MTAPISIEPAAGYARDARRITRTLFVMQSLSQTGTVGIFPVYSIAGAALSGNATWAGVPGMVYQLGTALAAQLWGNVMDRLGRRRSLMLGMAAGGAGAVVAAAGLLTTSLLVFLVGIVLIGFAVSAVQLGRFVAAEVHPPAFRARAISTVVLGGTVGALLAPLLIAPATRLAAALSVQDLVAPFGLYLGLVIVIGLVLTLGLRPEPRDLARLVARDQPQEVVSGNGRALREIVRRPAVLVAMSAMVFGQLTMVMLMLITSLHMRAHQHPLSGISLVISSHVVGMYAFSVISGRLADRWGRGPVILTGTLVLIAATLVAPLSPRLLPLAVGLFLLGLGWNFCYVGGSTLLADQLTPPERARTQGFNDLLVGLASAVGSLGSGIVFGVVGYAVMAMVAGAAALVPLTLTGAWQAGQRALKTEPS